MKKTAIAVLMAVSASGAMAQEKGLFGMAAKPNTFSYTYVEGGMLHMDRHDMNGLRFNGSFAVVSNLSVIGSVTAATRGRADLHTISAGVAYHQELQGTLLKQTDFVIHASAEYADFRYDNRWGKDYKDDDVGLLTGAGIRHQLIKDLEVFGDFSIRTTGSTDTLVTLGARYSILPQLQVGGSLEVSDNDVVMASVRYSF